MPWVMFRLPCLALVLIAALGPDRALATDIGDPGEFVKDVYKKLAASETSTRGPYAPPTDIYSPRLAALFAADEARAKGEVGCIDFDFWINAQDSELKEVRVTVRPASSETGSLMVIATFRNGPLQEIHFDFKKIGGRWLLDDVHSVKKPQWTLSALLKCQ